MLHSDEKRKGCFYSVHSPNETPALCDCVSRQKFIFFKPYFHTFGHHSSVMMTLHVTSLISDLWGCISSFSIEEEDTQEISQFERTHSELKTKAEN